MDAELQVGGDLRHVGVADDDVQAAVLLRVGVRLVPGVDDRPLERGLQAHLDLEEVGPLADLEALAARVLADADLARAGDDLPGDEERRQVPDDVGERRGPPHQVVLVAAVGGALVVGVVLVELDRARWPGIAEARTAASCMTRSPALSQITAARGLVHSGVEYSGWAWSTYSRAPLVRITLASPRSSSVSWLGSATSLARSNPRASRSGFSSSKSHRARRALAAEARQVGVHDLRGGHHRVGPRLSGHGDAVLGLDAHHPPYRHAHPLFVRDCLSAVYIPEPRPFTMPGGPDGYGTEAFSPVAKGIPGVRAGGETGGGETVPRLLALTNSLEGPFGHPVHEVGEGHRGQHGDHGGQPGRQRVPRGAGMIRTAAVGWKR